MSGFYFVAAPYASAEDKEQRFLDITKQTARLTKMGNNCYSPITHGHMLEKFIGPQTFEWWMATNRPFLDACKAIIVLKFDGWEESPGVTHEISVSREENKLVLYQDVT